MWCAYYNENKKVILKAYSAAQLKWLIVGTVQYLSVGTSHTWLEVIAGNVFGVNAQKRTGITVGTVGQWWIL